MLVAAGGYQMVKIWRAPEDRELLQYRDPASQKALLAHGDQVPGVALSPDGKVLATASLDGKVLLWDTATGSPQRTIAAAGPLYSVAFSSDGKLLATGGAKNIRLWDVATGNLVHEYEGHQGIVTGVAFTPAGDAIASSSADQTLRLWELPSHRELKSLDAHKEAVNAMATSPDGKLLATASADMTVKVFDLATGKILKRELRRTSATV